MVEERCAELGLPEHPQMCQRFAAQRSASAIDECVAQTCRSTRWAIVLLLGGDVEHAETVRGRKGPTEVLTSSLWIGQASAMKRTVLAVAVLGLMTACGSSGTSVPLTADSAAVAIRSAVPQVTGLTELTAATDGNSMLGKPNGYTAAVVINDTRAACNGGPGVDCGGVIEQWPDNTGAQQRSGYLAGVIKAHPGFAETDVVRGNLLLRVAGKIPADGVAAYKSAFITAQTVAIPAGVIITASATATPTNLKYAAVAAYLVKHGIPFADASANIDASIGSICIYANILDRPSAMRTSVLQGIAASQPNLKADIGVTPEQFLAAGIAGCKASGFVPAPLPSPTPAAPSTSAAPPSPAPPALTSQQENAVSSAQQYLSMGQGFSRQGLIDQLDSSVGGGYSVGDATAAVDSLGADWNVQAVLAAQSYKKLQAWSCRGLIGQLDSSAGGKFTYAQASYGAHQAGVC